MIHIMPNGIKFLLLLSLIFLLSCSENKITFYELQEYKGTKIHSREYFVDDNQLSLELRSVHASLRGDYRMALSLTSQLLINEKSQNRDSYESMINYLKSKVSDTTINEESLLNVKKILSWYQGITKKDSVFKNYNNKNALNQIVKESKNHHFTLINEAHYSQQHRAFTNSLLKPLWDIGYRYLALEGIAYDENIKSRGYAIYDSGYYTKDSSFANLIRNALKLGYIIVPYESKTKSSGSIRDFEQAENLFNATYKKDTIGKVLVHAGYSHIRETGDEGYFPLGYHLKKIINMDILTVDQERMCERGSLNQENSYFKFMLDNFEVNEPIVFINSKQTYLVDPIHEGAIDMQVYHPRTDYILGRPNWLINSGNNIYPLPKKINRLKGYFAQAINEKEQKNSVPYDQFVIDSGETGIILEKGSYILRIFNTSGELKKIYKVKVNK
jgi:hypothetical protein